MSTTFSADRAVPVYFEDAPVAHDLRAAADVLLQFATRAELPAVAIHNAGQNIGDALKSIRPFLPPCLTIGSRWTRAKGGDGLWAAGAAGEPVSNFGWHIDEYPFPDESMLINLHFTEGGEGDAEFLMPLYPLRPGNGELACMREGRVDPERYAAVGHRLQIRRGTLVPFKLGAPVAHNFVTTLGPRRFSSQLGRLMIA